MHLPPRIPFFGFERDATPCVRFLGDIAIFVTHWDKFAKRSTPCRDHCADCDLGREVFLLGYAPAQRLGGRGRRVWETCVYDVARGWLADFQPGLRGRTYVVRRAGVHGRTHEFVGESIPNSAAFDIERWARRFWRIPDDEQLKTIPFAECLATLDAIQLSEPAEDILPFRGSSNPQSTNDPSPEERQRVRQILDQRFGRKAGA